MADILPTNAELASFVEQARRDRPVAWAAVERLQRACWSQQTLTPKDLASVDGTRRVAVQDPPLTDA